MRQCYLVITILSMLCVWGCERRERSPTAPSSADGDQRLDTRSREARPPEPKDQGAHTGRPAPSSKGERFAIVPETHPWYSRLEVPDMPNACAEDADCHIGGCSNETCSAEPDVITTCELLPIRLPEGSQCGCLDAHCRWWHSEGARLETKGFDDGRPQPRDGAAPDDMLAPCGTRTCKPGQVCVSYFGVAGSRGPQQQSCEWLCRPDELNVGCPEGTRCLTIVDGPGSVCR